MVDRHNDKEDDKHTKPGIPRPGEQPDQLQQPEAPPQPRDIRPGSSQWIPPTTGNPDLDPCSGHQRPDFPYSQQRNPVTPQGMLFDPNQLLESRRREDFARPGSGICPPEARFDPFGPPDPDSFGPGRRPMPSSQFGVPDPDHLPPPGMPQQSNRPPNPFGSKSLKFPGPPNNQPFGGSGGGPFL